MSGGHQLPDVVARWRSRGGFTLLEVMLAVALATMLLVAVNFFVLSMGELWSGGAEPRLFERHVRGVTRFVESLVQQAVVTEDTTAAGKSTAAVERPAVRRSRSAPRPMVAAAWSGAPVLTRVAAPSAAGVLLGENLGWRLAGLAVQLAGPPPDRGGMGRLPPGVRGADGTQPPPRATTGGRSRDNSEDPGMTEGVRFRFGTPAGYEGSPVLLMFEVDEAPGQCVWPGRPLPQVECALQINADEGLVLLWKSKLEDDYGTARPRKTQLSPFGRAISFDYYDSESRVWTHSDQPRTDSSGSWAVPQRIRLRFAYGEMEREVAIALPDTPGGAPLR